MILALLVLVSLQGTTPAGDSTLFLRINQVGYLPDGPKVAVACALAPVALTTFRVIDARGIVRLDRQRARAAAGFGPCVETYRLDFSALRRPGRYQVEANGVRSPAFRIGAHVYDGGADTLLYYMRQQRSGWNPVFGDSVHRRDGIIVDSPRAGDTVHVSGGWADASDYLQYVATSATATADLLMAYRDHPGAFADRFEADGRAGRNGRADVLDEARHGLEWLVRMAPGDSVLFNQIADDRDHAFFDLPTTDSSDYGWGRGGARPVYECTGRPQGLFGHQNRSTGLASTAGKFASAFALGARLFARSDPAFAALLAHKARAAYQLGRAHPGVCQTAPGHAPYFYEEANWADDMELAAATLAALDGGRDDGRGDGRGDGRDGRRTRIADGAQYAAMEPVTPWMGADTARHYEWYPWYNAGHAELWRAATTSGDRRLRRSLAGDDRAGLRAVAARATNGFLMGVPFIWCSNDLVASFATQAMRYRQMTGDTTFRAQEQAAIDWLFGTNPWGVSMVIGYPHDAVSARDPHSAVAAQLGLDRLLGGLLDGPVYRSIFGSLKGIALHHADPYARFNTGRMVYHDDLGDYSTNEPIMDGTANLAWLLSALAGPPSPHRQGEGNPATAR
jgi:endoglucanase